MADTCPDWSDILATLATIGFLGFSTCFVAGGTLFLMRERAQPVAARNRPLVILANMGNVLFLPGLVMAIWGADAFPCPMKLVCFYFAVPVTFGAATVRMLQLVARYKIQELLKGDKYDTESMDSDTGEDDDHQVVDFAKLTPKASRKSSMASFMSSLRGTRGPDNRSTPGEEVSPAFVADHKKADALTRYVLPIVGRRVVEGWSGTDDDYIKALRFITKQRPSLILFGLLQLPTVVVYAIAQADILPSTAASHPCCRIGTGDIVAVWALLFLAFGPILFVGGQILGRVQDVFLLGREVRYLIAAFFATSLIFFVAHAVEDYWLEVGPPAGLLPGFAVLHLGLTLFWPVVKSFSQEFAIANIEAETTAAEVDDVFSATMRVLPGVLRESDHSLGQVGAHPDLQGTTMTTEELMLEMRLAIMKGVPMDTITQTVLVGQRLSVLPAGAGVAVDSGAAGGASVEGSSLQGSSIGHGASGSFGTTDSRSPTGSTLTAISKGDLRRIMSDLGMKGGSGLGSGTLSLSALDWGAIDASHAWDVMPLSTTLRVRALRAAFKGYLRTEFSLENLLFYERVQTFKAKWEDTKRDPTPAAKSCAKDTSTGAKEDNNAQESKGREESAAATSTTTSAPTGMPRDETQGGRTVEGSASPSSEEQVEGDEEKEKQMAEMAEEVKGIYEKFIKPGAAYQVNVSGSQEFRVRRQIKKGVFSATMLDEAQREIFKLMERDSFPRFKNHRTTKGRGITALGRFLRRMARAQPKKLADGAASTGTESVSDLARSRTTNSAAASLSGSLTYGEVIRVAAGGGATTTPVQ